MKTSSIPKLALNGTQPAEELPSLYRIEANHLEAIRSMREEVRPRVEGVIENFYQWMGTHPEMMAFLKPMKSCCMFVRCRQWIGSDS